MSAPAKPKYRTTDWKDCNTALKARGSLLIWLDKDMYWHGSASGKRGRRPKATASKEAHTIYGTEACGNCKERNACTSTTRGRRIAHFKTDLYRDALRTVMEQPQVKPVFGQRKAMVEPVFSHLRGKQGLNRFRRKGMQAVMREFALHALAHNVSRALALLRAFICVFLGQWVAICRAENSFQVWNTKTVTR